MVQAGARRRYPYNISVKNWWDLRRKFGQSPPRQVSPSYLQAVLEIGAPAASHVLSDLKAIGLVDTTNALTQRAIDWRDDQRYAEVCQQLRNEIYPGELLDAFPPPAPDRGSVQSWFKRETRTGDPAANKMAALYLLLCEADPNASDKALDRASQRPTPREQRRRPAGVQERRSSDPQPVIQANQHDARRIDADNGLLPTVHVDIQIHIDANASSEQIDQIFRSMRQHLYGKEMSE